MRTATALLFAGLVATLLGVPAPASGGPVCQTGYFPQQTYVQSYSAPSYVAPTYSTYVPYAVPVDTFYRVAPDLAAARVAAEAADAAIAKLKAEMARQAADQQATADRAAQLQFQQQVLAVLQQLAAGKAPPATPDDYARLQAENAQMRAALEKIIREGRPPAAGPAPAGPTPPIPPPGAAAEPPPAAPPPIPPGATGALVNPAKPELVASVKKLFAANCMPCHSTGNAEHLTDLTAPERLTYEKLCDCFNRTVSNNPKFVMPKGKPPGSVPAELPPAVHELSITAPHDPRLTAKQ